MKKKRLRHKTTVAIIPSAGKGKRFGGKKNYLSLNGTPVLARTIETLEDCPLIEAIVLVVRREDIEYVKNSIVKKIQPEKGDSRGKRRQGEAGFGRGRASGRGKRLRLRFGARRGAASRNAGNPRTRDKSRLPARRLRSGNAAEGYDKRDTRKIHKKTIPRDTLVSVQTPQVFKYDILKRACEMAAKDGFRSTDEAALVERLGVKIIFTPGSYENIKITTKEDLATAELILKTRQGLSP